MASLNRGLNAVKRCCRIPDCQVQQLNQQFQGLRLAASGSSRKYSQILKARLKPAEEIPEETLELAATLDIAKHARAVPISPSYFSRRQQFNDSYLLLQKLFRQFAHLPVVPAGQAERVVWKTLRDFKQEVAEDVKSIDYVQCIAMVKRLHNIHPDVKPPAVDSALGLFKRDVQVFQNTPNPIPVDRFGRAMGVGKRKSSVARAWVVEGTGEVLINGKSLAEAFGRVHDRESAVWALRATERIDKYNVWALVEGGGTTGQAEALTLAVARALMAHEPALKPTLRRAGCVTRDPRSVERKKHGRVKARKMPTWVKR